MNVATILKSKGRAVVTAPPDTTLLDIASKLAARKIGAIVIIGENGRLAGIVSERDIVRTIAERGASALDLPVSEVMSRDVICCSESNLLDEVLSVMTQRRHRHLPVVENGALTGIVSIGDVVKLHIAEVEMEVTAMRSYLATS